jgi:hypothetical protein
VRSWMYDEVLPAMLPPPPSMSRIGLSARHRCRR